MALGRVFALLIVLFILMPVLIVIMMSFNTTPSFRFPPAGLWLGYYWKFIGSPDWMAALSNSLLIAFASTILTLVLTTPAAFALTRHAFSGRGSLNIFILTPMMVPHIALALGYYNLLANFRLLGTHVGMIVVHAALNIPICFLILSANLKGFDRNLERAAANLGAGPIRTFFTVTLPILSRGFIIAGLFSFLASFDETTISLFISGLAARTLPSKMFATLSLEPDPVIAAASGIVIMFVLTILILSFAFNLRGSERRQP